MSTRNLDRREFIALLGAAAAWPLMARAQESGRVYRIGQLLAAPQREVERLSAPFFPTLAELGFVEGRNLTVDTRSAEARLELLPALATELVALKPDLIVALPAAATAAAKAATSDIPILFAFVNDPVGLHFAESLSRPGGNLTGLSNFSVAIAGKRVELLREAVPGLRRLAIWWNSESINDALEFAELNRAAVALGLETLALDTHVPSDYEKVAAQTRDWGADGLCFTANPTTFTNRRQIIDLVAKLGRPAIYWNGAFVEDGGLMSYAVSFQDLARRAASYAARILRGARPSDLPIEQPTKFELVVNLKTAKRLDVAVPQSILMRADQVIE